MTRALTIILVLALPVLAEEKKAEEKKAEQATPTAAAAPQAQPDSPLVAAAKRANRLGKKPANVITNATLKTSGANAHVTTTDKQAIFQMPQPLEPPRATPEMIAMKAQQEQRAKAAEQAEKDRKAKQEQEQKAQTQAVAHEEGYDGTQDDASEFTGANPPPPQF
ncbi:MAG TPA: hypothetical protein VF432_19580 [Thermoanaerobaculia bacterium]